jgi:hypothetical protein
MPIKIKLGDAAQPEKKPTQATVSLKISKTLGGNLLINDHKHMDIIVVPKENKVVTIPKPYAEVDTFPMQKDFMYALFKGGVIEGFGPKGGPSFGMLEVNYPQESDVDSLQAVLYQVEKYIKETMDDGAVSDAYDENIEDRFVDPTDEESTESGEVPPYEDTPEGSRSPSYSYYGYGYQY